MTLACHASNAGSIPARIVALHVQTVHLLIINMQSAFDNIKSTYDYEECKEIARLGCATGVCSQHVYYGDTIGFFDKYADQVHSYIKDILGVEALVELFKKNNGELDMYKNDMTWTFIELVASYVVDEYEEQERSDEETIGNYMKEEISNNGYTLADIQAQAAQLAEVFGS